MRLPSRWVTNPGSTLNRRADLIARSALFLCPPTWEGDALATRRRRKFPKVGPRAGKTHRTERKRREMNERGNPPNRTGEVPERRCGEAVPGRRYSTPGKSLKKGRKSAGKAMQGRRSRGDGAGETVQERRCNTPGKAEPPVQETRTTDSPKTTTYPETPAPLKKPGSPGKLRLTRPPAPPWKTPARQNQKENSSWSLS